MSGTFGIRMITSKTKLGKFLRAHRLKRGLAQNQVAKVIDISQSHYSALETGRIMSLNPKYVPGLSEKLRCQSSQLKNFIFKKIELGIEVEPKVEPGKTIWRQRKKLGLTLRQLAEISRVNIAILWELERGNRRGFYYDRIIPLAQALKLPLSVLSNYAGWQTIPTKDPFGRKIREKRKEKGLSQKQVAQQLRISRQYLSQIELGQAALNTEITEPLIKRISRFLK